MNNMPPIQIEQNSKMVLVINTSLKMSNGKMAAQVGHATLMTYKTVMSSGEAAKICCERWEIFGQPKIAVKVENSEKLEEIYSKAIKEGITACMVHDAGYTQVPTGSKTVLGLFGSRESVDRVTGHLKLL